MNNLTEATNEKGILFKIGDTVKLTNLLNGKKICTGIVKNLNKYVGGGLIANLTLPNGSIVVKTLSSAVVLKSEN